MCGVMIERKREKLHTLLRKAISIQKIAVVGLGACVLGGGGGGGGGDWSPGIKPASPHAKF